MKGLFGHSRQPDPVWLAEELPGPGKPITLADRACCCPARPVVTVIMPPGPGRLDSVDLMLCGHHYRTSRAALAAVGAEVYDEHGRLIADGDRRLRAGPASAPGEPIVYVTPQASSHRA